MVSEWPTQSLREANVTLIDCDHRTPPASEDGYPYVAIPQVRNGRIDLSDVRRITREHFVEWTRRAKPCANDVVLSRRCNPGETAFVPPGLEFALGQNLVLLRADGTRVYPPFLRWLVRGPEWWEQIGTFLNVGAVFDSLKCADIPNFRLRIPPLREQRAIAHILGTLDDKIELDRRMNETLETMARALFKSWFVDFDPVRAKSEGRDPGLPERIADLFPDSFEDSELGEIPKGWRIVSLGEVCRRVAMGPFGSDIKTDNFIDIGVPVVRGCNLRDGFVDDGFVYLSEEKADSLRNANALPGDIVITHRGTLGQLGLIPRRSRFARYVVSQSQMLLSANPCLSSPHFLFEFLRSSAGQHQLLANTSQTGVPAIARPTTSVKAIQLVLPQLVVLQRFEDILLPLIERSIGNIAESRTLAALRDTLLPKLISGELRVPDTERIIGTAAVPGGERRSDNSDMSDGSGSRVARLKGRG